MQLRQKSILVIDDDAGMLRALEKVLSGEGATVATADRVPEATEYLRRARPKTDLVLTDLRMPGKGGTAVLESVLAIAPQIPVIVITAFGNSKIRADCLARGAVKVLEKPVNTQQLLTAITSAFDHLSLRLVAAARITNRPSDGREITQIGGPI